MWANGHSKRHLLQLSFLPIVCTDPLSLSAWSKFVACLLRHFLVCISLLDTIVCLARHCGVCILFLNAIDRLHRHRLDHVLFPCTVVCMLSIQKSEDIYLDLRRSLSTSGIALLYKHLFLVCQIRKTKDMTRKHAFVSMSLPRKE